MDLYYTAKVYLGTPAQEVNVIWDTGSSKLVLETQHCSNCIAKVFHTDKSTTFDKFKPEV